MILQKNSDYVLKLEKELENELNKVEFQDLDYLKIDFMEKAINHAKFLKQPLKPGMFVPCDENGNVLQNPGLIPSFELERYRKAQEKVLFKNGIKVGDKHFEIKDTRGILAKDIIVIGVGFKNGIYQTIEDLANNFNSIELTENAIKQFE